MRRFLIVIFSCFILCHPTTISAQDINLEKCYGSIRADLLRYACDLLSIPDAIVNSIDTVSITNFKQTVSKYKDSTNVKSISHLNKIIVFSPLICGNDLKTDYTNLSVFIDSICKSLSDSLTSSIPNIEKTKKDFHNRLACATIEYSAYQAVQIDTIVKAKFEEIFYNGFFVQVQPEFYHQQSDPSLNEYTNKREESFINNILKLRLPFAVVCLIFIVVIAYIYYRFAYKKKKVDVTQQQVIVNPINDTIQEQQTGTISSISSTINDQTDENDDQIIIPKEIVQTNNDKGLVYDDSSISIIGSSVIGNSHISMKLPCQDSCGYKNLGNGWGIAVTSDGAGSAQHSEIGSKIVTTRAIEHFKDFLTNKGWITNKHIPTDAEWTQGAYNVIKTTYDDIRQFANAKSIEVKSLSATVIVVVHTPFGLLTCHVGDGRAGYRSDCGEWKSIITPHKGEEANQTIFLTSDFWQIPNFVMSGVMVPECRIIKDKVTAFTLMSDGCESASWLFNQQNDAGVFYDPNLPYSKFFEPLVKSLKEMHDNNVPVEERLIGWEEFLKQGGKFAKEPDDKTMILGLIL